MIVQHQSRQYLMEMRFHQLLLLQLVLLVFVFNLPSSSSSLQPWFRPPLYLHQLIEASREAKVAQQPGGWRKECCKCPKTKKLVDTAAQRANVKCEEISHAYRKVNY